MMHALYVIGTILLVLIGIVVLFMLCLFSKVVFKVFSFVIDYICGNIKYVILGFFILVVLIALIIG